jgi:hypothetical protein
MPPRADERGPSSLIETRTLVTETRMSVTETHTLGSRLQAGVYSCALPRSGISRM